MSHGLPDFLVNYLVERDAQRANAVDAFLERLTPRERGLFHDAAVMGYVQGLMRNQTEGCPKDPRIMALVAAECLALPDLYPTVTAVAQQGTASACRTIAAPEPPDRRS